MISFFPGPSQLNEEIPDFIESALKSNILSANHRSQQFMDMYSETVEWLKRKLNVPENYQVVFAGSATECWEILAQSIIMGQSYHIFNGAFGERWYQTTHAIKPGALKHYFKPEKELAPAHFIVPGLAEMIAITHNETSNGTQVPVTTIQNIRSKYKEKLIAIDATSSLGGIDLPLESGDVWYASVQKCFGLPAGLAVMILSPRAVKAAQKIKDRGHYNSLVALIEQGKKNQTNYTPNVMAIYLLGKSMKNSADIVKLNKTLKINADRWYDLLNSKNDLKPFVKERSIQSDTVICVRANDSLIGRIKAAASKEGILVGNGYGKLEGTTFRIANFPSHSQDAIDKLMQIIDMNSK